MLLFVKIIALSLGLDWHLTKWSVCFRVSEQLTSLLCIFIDKKCFILAKICGPKKGGWILFDVPGIFFVSDCGSTRCTVCSMTVWLMIMIGLGYTGVVLFHYRLHSCRFLDVIMMLYYVHYIILQFAQNSYQGTFEGWFWLII